MVSILNQFKGSPEKGVVLMDGLVHVASDGYVSAPTTSLKGVTITQVAPATYELTLSRVYPALLAAQVSGLGVTSEHWKVISVLAPDGTASKPLPGAAGLGPVLKIRLMHTDESGTPVPAADITCSVSLTLKYSTAK